MLHDGGQGLHDVGHIDGGAPGHDVAVDEAFRVNSLNKFTFSFISLKRDLKNSIGSEFSVKSSLNTVIFVKIYFQIRLPC